MEGLVLVGDPQAAVCSPCTALEPYTPPRADVRGYYAALGVPATATRAELLDAYRAHGCDDPWLTFCFKQLWNPAVRAAYDAVPRGGEWIDAYLADEMWRRAAQAASRWCAEGHSTTAADILSSLGLDTAVGFRSQGATPLDTDESPLFHERRSNPRHGDDPPASGWDYAYFRYATTCEDTARLGAWQQAVIRLLAEDHSSHPFAVGFHEISDEPVFVAEFDGLAIFFLHADPAIAPVDMFGVATAEN